MKKLTVNEFKTRFSIVVKQARSGERIAVTFGRKKEIVGYFLFDKPKPKAKRMLGILEGKASVIFHSDFRLTDEDFLRS